MGDDVIAVEGGSPPRRAKVLCVDDDPAAVQSLRRHLHREFDVAAVTSGGAALDHLAADEDIAVIMCDLRMPRIDGIEILRRARDLRPSTVRLLLTGDADPRSVGPAVDDGLVYRLLLKPCLGETLLAVLRDAADEHGHAGGSETALHGSRR